MKRELFIQALLRVYSQEVFSPEKLFDEFQTEDEFVSRVNEIMKAYIRERLVEDDVGMKREVSLHLFRFLYYDLFSRLEECTVQLEMFSLEKNKQKQ